MRNIRLSAIIILLLFPFFSCTDDRGIDIKNTLEIEPVFSEKDMQWGNLFAKNLFYINKKIKNENIDFKTISQLHSYAQKKSLEFFSNNNLKKSNKPFIDKESMNFSKRSSIGEIFKKNLNKLTDNQKEVFELIARARQKSSSYLEFSNKLATINNSIYSSIPVEEQKTLFFVTSTLHYGLKAMNDMAREGIISGASEENRKK